MKKLFYVGVYINERIHFGMYGFTSYVDCYTEADDTAEAKENATNYFETKYKVTVTGTRISIASRKYCNEPIIKPFDKPNDFENLNNPIKTRQHEQATIFSTDNGRNERKGFVASFRERSTVFINRIFFTRKGYNRARIQ